MSKEKYKLFKKLIAITLSFFMVISVVPQSAAQIFAATQQHPDAITITVKDEQGKPIQGANIEFEITSQTHPAENKKGVVISDEFGCVEVLAKANYVANDFVLNAIISKEGYEVNKNIKNIALTSSTQNVEATLVSTTINDVQIEGKTLTYNGKNQELLTILGLLETDTIDFGTLPEGVTLNRNQRPVAKKAGTYSLNVTVQREGKTDFVKKVDVTIAKADVELTLTANKLAYNEKEQELVTVDGLMINDKIKWIVNDQPLTNEFITITDLSKLNIPTAQAVNENPGYKVELQVERENFKQFSKVVHVQISKGNLNLEGLIVDGLNSVYRVDKKGTPVAQNAVKVTSQQGVLYTLKYQLDEGDTQIDPSAWTDTVPTVTNAGSYIVWVKAIKEGYNDKDVPVNPAAGALAPYNVYIAKANQELKFEKQQPEYTTITKDEITNGKVMNFAAIDEQSLANGTITYSITIKDGDADIATIDQTGKLTVTNAGEIEVVATLSGNENYNECQIKHTIKIGVETNKPGDLISFEKNEVKYEIGDINANLQNIATKTNPKDTGKITYRIDKGVEYGLSIHNGRKNDVNNGKITVDDYTKLIKAVSDANGTLEITVYADKAEVRSWFGRIKYASDQTSYKLIVSFVGTPQNPYTLSSVDGLNGWYKSAVTVTPLAGYTISKTEVNAKGDNFSDTIQFANQGTSTRYVYLKEVATGKITNKIPVDVKIDTEKPYDLKVEYAKSPLDKFLELITLGFYNPSVTLRFSATDDTSKLSYLDWAYTREQNQSQTNVDTESGRLEFVDGKAEITLTADQQKQYRGNISFTAYDKAGNSTSINDDKNIIVVDTISATMEVKYAGKESYVAAQNSIGKQHYFNGDVEVEFTVTEANFNKEDIKVSITKDGKKIGAVNDVVWNDINADIHKGTFTISGDGDYVIDVEYEDQSGNMMQPYHSETITIDTIVPKIEMIYSHNGEEQKTIFKVEERNFRASDVSIVGTAKDINNNDLHYSPQQLNEYLQNAKWEKVGEHTYQVEYDGYVDGIYNLTCNYKDLANHNANPFVADEFIIDHTAASNVDINYSKSILDMFLETITLGFYNPDVTVTFSANDVISGVDSFTWKYTKQSNQSNINRPSDDASKVETQVIKAIQDRVDLSKFSAQITLSAKEAEQLRGYISVAAKDVYNNATDTFSDNQHILVVDTISPTMEVSYSKEARRVGNTSYYNGDALITFKVNEANFFAEDVIVSITKDGKETKQVTPKWVDESVDVHVGTYTLSGDGDYVVNVEYKDRSNNRMDSYTSHTITIDTLKPVIGVEYQNKNVINTLKDREQKNRKYFNDTQSAIVTIKEHNFDANEVDFKIEAKDVTGKVLDASTLHTKTKWSMGKEKDTHIITITYPKDANYTFDVDYTDLATNQADNYKPDYFTVDKTAPTDLKVSYSTSILDTVLESLSFGFYNAKMTVTLSASDITSGVHNFKYSYVKANEVSDVNAELIDQAIQAADITYSKDGKKATMTFSVPKMVLGKDNQFNGTVEFSAFDRANNESHVKESKRIVVDNIAPTANVQFNQPVNEANNVAYYNGNINATIMINEANFYADDVQVIVNKDGVSNKVVANWKDVSKDLHVGTFTLQGDGDYTVTINYNDKSSNRMATYTSKKMTIDTKIEKPKYTINGQAKDTFGGAYKGDVKIGFSFNDQNFANKTVELTRTRFDKVEDVTTKFINVSNNDKGGAGSFSIPDKVGNDGIYVLKITMSDHANHKSESEIKFTINRYGSVYEYSDELVNLIKNGGQFVDHVNKDLVITEYNADRILENSLQLLITRDGEAIDVDYTTNPRNINAQVGIGESGWYQYVYTIKASNFKKDGVYKISLNSKYATNDSSKNESTSVPENSMNKKGNKIVDTMTFTVDSALPEIRNIVNLDKAIADKDKIVNGKLNIKYTIVDVGGLKCIEIIVNGKTVQKLTSKEIGEDLYNFTGSFDLKEQSGTKAHKVQIRVTDLAGNVTDTNSEAFLNEHAEENKDHTYVFFNEVTVSRNFFVRWYANSVLFWGSIIGVIALIGGIWFIIIFKRKKDDEEEEQQ